jgi:hypothetical protein
MFVGVETGSINLRITTMAKPKNMAKNRYMQLLKCRELAHEWDEHLRKVRDAGWGRHRVLRCPCGTERIELIDINGEISSRHYEYPDDYHIVGSMSKIEAREERLAILNGGSMKGQGIKAELAKRRDGKRANLRIVS